MEEIKVLFDVGIFDGSIKNESYLERSKFMWLDVSLVCVLVLTILTFFYSTAPKMEFLGNGNFAISSVSVLPDGVYEVLFEVSRNMFSVIPSTALKGPEIYLIHISEIPKKLDGSLVEHFIKEGKSIQ